MKAIITTAYGSPDVLQLQEVEKPTPKDKEVLIRIHATAVNSGDWRVRSLEVPPGFGIIVRLLFGFNRPRQPILGTVLAGTVEAVGAEVTNFKPGDRVMAMDGAKMGAHAEYKTLPADGAVVPLPEELGFEEGAAIPFGGLTALYFLRDLGKIQSGDQVLINGASGAVGTAAIQLAKHFGAEVTAVNSAANAELVTSLGADHVIDYKQEDFTASGQTYDLIMDNVGNAPFARSQKALKPGGRLLAVVAGMPEMLRAVWVNLTGNKKILPGTATESAADLQWLADLAAEGKFRAVIDRRYPLAETAEAHRRVDSGRKRGNVVVTVVEGG